MSVARRVFTAIVAAVVLVSPLGQPTSAQEPDLDRLVELYAEYWDTTTGTDEEAGALLRFQDELPEDQDEAFATFAEVHRQLTEDRIGQNGIDVFRRYWLAPIDSVEESQAYAEFVAIVEAAVDSNPTWTQDSLFALARGIISIEEDMDDPGQISAVDIQEDLQSDKYERDEIGTITALGSPEIDVTLTVSKQLLVAGELWSVFGEIHNRSSQTVWIVHRFCNLTLAPELYGRNSDAGSVVALFPTANQTDAGQVAEATMAGRDQIVRIERGSSYTVVWKVDPFDTASSDGSLHDPYADRVADYTTRIREETITPREGTTDDGQTGESADEEPDENDSGGDEADEECDECGPADSNWNRIGSTFSNFLFFLPGEYPVSANVHVWIKRPQLDDDGIVINPGESITKTSRIAIHMEASPWALILGAIIGGVLAFLLKSMNLRDSVKHDSIGAAIVKLVFGLGSALLLTSIVTILLSRLSSAQFLINVNVRDFWGAVATGFVVQWFGFKYLAQVLQDDRDRATAAAAAAGGSTVAVDAPEEEQQPDSAASEGDDDSAAQEDKKDAPDPDETEESSKS